MGSELKALSIESVRLNYDIEIAVFFGAKFESLRLELWNDAVLRSATAEEWDAASQISGFVSPESQ